MSAPLPPTETLRFAGPAGLLEGRLEPGELPLRAAAVLAPPHPLYGGSLATNMVVHAARALAGIGVVTLRFNFRGVGSSAGAFARGVGEREDLQAALRILQSRFEVLPLLVGGCSFGAIRAMECADQPGVAAYLGIVPPLLSPENARAPAVRRPAALILAGRDSLVEPPTPELLAARFPLLRRMVVVEEADHLFDGCLERLRRAVVECAAAVLP